MSQDVDIMLSAGGVSSKFKGNMTILQRTWTHICWIHTPGQDTIYSNGKVLEPRRLAGEDQETFVKNADVYDSALILGQTPSKVREDFSIRKMFQGFLTELNIWNKELTKDEIQKITKKRGRRGPNLLFGDLQMHMRFRESQKMLSKLCFLTINSSIWYPFKVLEHQTICILLRRIRSWYLRGLGRPKNMSYKR